MSYINQMKFNSFKYSGINNSSDGSEDDKFREYVVIEKEMRLF